MSTYLLIELISFVIFAIYFWHARKNQQVDLLFYAAGFAFLFENLNMALFVSETDGYYYNSAFNFFVSDTPLFIILLWSAIIYSAYKIIGNIVSGRALFFLAPLYILALDLVLDQVATRLGLWTWIGFEAQTGIFSVPSSNYIGWLLVSFFFIVTWEYFKDKKAKSFLYGPENKFLDRKKSRIFQPFLAYLLFLSSSLLLYPLKINFFNDNLRMQYSLLILIVAIFGYFSFYYYKKNEIGQRIPLMIFIVRPALHLFSLWGMIYFGLFNNPIIVICFVLVLIFEIWVFWENFRLAKKTKI